MSRAKISAAALAAILVSGCDNKPAHYLVLCDQKDGQGWELIDYVKQDGYLMSCTYQSPDKAQSYTNRCDAEGCGIK